MASEELLETFDDSGRPSGIKTRAEVHRDADWHLLAFVWAARAVGDRIHFLLQVRGRPDDRFFGHVDAPAGGHVPAREHHLDAALRESEEEMGVKLSADDLLYLGRRQVESLGMDCMRTFQHHYLSLRPLGIEDASHTPEVHGFVEVDVADFAALVSGRTASIAARISTKDAPTPAATVLDSRSIALYTREVRETFRLVSEATRFAIQHGGADPHIFL